MDVKSGVSLFSLILVAFFPPSLHSDTNNSQLVSTANANTAAVQKAAYAPPETRPSSGAAGPAAELSAIVFSAPPRETAKVGQETYGPIATYLSGVLGKKVVYSHPGNWGVYRTKMVQGQYDLVFDGPHFNSYRAEILGHNILVKIPGTRDFRIIVKKDAPISNTARLAGRTVCTHAPPNLGTLILLSQFTNPARQPAIINTKGWKGIYDGVAAGKCTAGILPGANLQKYDTAGTMKVLYKGIALPDQAFSASPRLDAEVQAIIAQALISPDATQATQKLRTRFRGGERLGVASNNEYLGISEFLKNEWGYY